MNATNQIPGAVLIVRFRLAGIGSAGEGVHGFIARKSKCLRGQAADTGAWDASRQRLYIMIDGGGYLGLDRRDSLKTQIKLSH